MNQENLACGGEEEEEINVVKRCLALMKMLLEGKKKRLPVNSS